MQKITVEYEDFNGEQQKDVLYFHLFKSELLSIEFDLPLGLEGTIKKLAAEDDRGNMWKLFQLVLLTSYGEIPKDPMDGKHFNKSEAATQKFKNSLAYEALISYLTLSDKSNVVEFFNGLIITAAKK